MKLDANKLNPFSFQTNFITIAILCMYNKCCFFLFTMVEKDASITGKSAEWIWDVFF